ncbi:MAG: damage-inducible protein DinB [Rhizobiaceae bacterium MnEN-MB40S]|nr:MAG: damage-inducible protein DinB [Rhizobiaceae bacterium MnEN-MB40S]
MERADMKEHFEMFAAYNRWANDRICAAVDGVSDEDYVRDCGAFFKSLHGTLNHMIVADRIWLRRFTGKGEAPNSLDAILFDDFGTLRQARILEDRRIISWIGSLDEKTLEGEFTYTPVTNPVEVTQRLAPTLAHFFNHQTHHRGHLHMILSVLGHEPPPLDLIYYQRTEEGARFT